MPTALQLPAEAHDTEPTEESGPAFAGGWTSGPLAHDAAKASADCAANANSKPHATTVICVVGFIDRSPVRF